MPPMWALGFHLCRWGYKNTSEVQAVWKRNNQAGIPQVIDYYKIYEAIWLLISDHQDAQWIDIDYMNSFYDFTYDPVNFQTLPTFVDTLHSQNLKLVLITVNLKKQIFLNALWTSCFCFLSGSRYSVQSNNQLSSTNKRACVKRVYHWCYNQSTHSRIGSYLSLLLRSF